MLLKDKHILLGVTGGIAAYKSASLASLLTKQGARVHTLLTQNAMQFISPMTFEGITGERCVEDHFDRTTEFRIPHIDMATMADTVLIAPASANTIAKLAHGIADDMLTSTVLAATCPKLIAPAMNTHMYENPATQRNLDLLRQFGWIVIEPIEGRLACGVNGKGKMPEPEFLADCVYWAAAEKKDLCGKKVLVTAGPTREALDPVRYLTNHSSGKMGYAIAQAAARRGADVTLIAGPTELADPAFVNVIHVESAQQMFEAATQLSEEADFLVFAAAVADYRPAQIAEHKIKKEDGSLSITLERTQDILKTVGEHKKPHQKLCGFSMETRNLLENSRKKLDTKHADLICANNIKAEGSAFGGNTNQITLLTKRDIIELPLLSKYEAANEIWNALLNL